MSGGRQAQMFIVVTSARVSSADWLIFCKVPLPNVDRRRVDSRFVDS